MLNSLMKCHDTELNEGAKNDIGVRVMYMFNVARATQNEQRVEDHAWVKSAQLTKFRFNVFVSPFRACPTPSRSSLRFGYQDKR